MRGCRIVTFGLIGLALAAVALGRPSVAFGQQNQQPVPRAVLKLIIQHPALDPYLNPAVAGRGALVVSDHLLAPGITPSRFGEPIRILGDREAGALPHLRFRSFELSGARATTVVEYKARGVEATFVLEDNRGWWSVVDAKVVKH